MGRWYHTGHLLLEILPTLSKTRSGPLNATRALAMASVFLIPCRPAGKTTITFRYYHAVGADKTPTGDYELFETIVFEKERGK